MKASFIAGGGEARPGPAMRRAPLLLLALLLGSGLADSPRGKQRAARPREVLEAVSGAERSGAGGGGGRGAPLLGRRLFGHSRGCGRREAVGSVSRSVTRGLERRIHSRLQAEKGAEGCPLAAVSPHPSASAVSPSNSTAAPLQPDT